MMALLFGLGGCCTSIPEKIGYARCRIKPDWAVADARWGLTKKTRTEVSGNSLGAPPGEYTLRFLELPDPINRPVDVKVRIKAGQLSTVTGTYTRKGEPPIHPGLEEKPGTAPVNP